MNAVLAAATLNENLQEIVTKLSDLMNSFWIYIVLALGAVVVVWGAYVGIKIAVAHRNEEKINAREMVKSLIVGIIIIFVVAMGAPLLIKGLSAWVNSLIGQNKKGGSSSRLRKKAYRKDMPGKLKFIFLNNVEHFTRGNYKRLNGKMFRITRNQVRVGGFLRGHNDFIKNRVVRIGQNFPARNRGDKYGAFGKFAK